jgi:DNA-binding SARP family transcriptional activator/tetratricopeptide (TPR) repeat protein
MIRLAGIFAQAACEASARKDMPGNAVLSICLLGPLRLEANGSQLKFEGPRKAAVLFAYILLHARRRIDRKALAAALWPDDDEAAARTALRRHLYLLSRALPPSGAEPWIDADPTSLRWNPRAPATIDLERFLACSAGDARLAEAAALYTGDLLAGFDEEWIDDERERLRRLQTGNLERLVVTCREAGDLAGALRYAQDLLRLDSLHEEAMRHVIALRAELGDRAGAIAEFERFAQRLRDELDVPPRPETIAVYTSIVKRAAPAPPASPALEPAAPPQAPGALPFTGREGPLRELAQAWSRAVRGRGNLIVIGGAAGLGKTRLIEEFAARVEACRGSAFVGETSFIEAVPYEPFVDVLRRAAPRIAAAGLEAIRLDALASILPERRVAGRRPASPPLDAPGERSRLFEAIVAAFELLAAEKPVLLVCEDVHWAGAGTISLLEHLARRLAEARVLIVATYREEETLRSHPLRELLRRLQHEGRLAAIALGPLSFDDVREILEEALAALPDASLANRFFAATEGHPLFLSELVREIAAAGSAADMEFELANLPASVTAAIDVRLGRLSKAGRLLAEAAAVVGRGFEIEILGKSSALGGIEIGKGIAELLAGNIVRESGGRRSSYTFTHQMFQARAYERVPKVLRAERHLRVAQAIETLYPERRLELSSELAHHLEAAGERDRAAACYMLAAQRALDLCANEDAVAQATSGLALSPAPALLFELLLARESAFGRLARRREQGEDLERLAAAAGLDVSAEIACEVLVRRIAFARATGERERERAAIDELAARAGSERRRAQAQLALGAYLLAAGRFSEARPLLEEALRRFDGLRDMAGIVDAALEIVRLYRNERNDDGIRAMLARAEESLEDRPEARFARAKLLEQELLVEMRARRYRAMLPLGKKLIELSVSIGHAEGEALAYKFLGEAAAWQFNIVRARDFLERAARTFEQIGNRYQSYCVLADRGILAIFIGRFQEAEMLLEQARQAASELGFGFGVATGYLNLADCYNRSGDFVRARAAAEKARDLYAALGTQATPLVTYVNLGVAQRGCGDEALALETLERAAALVNAQSDEQTRAEIFSQLALSQLRAGRIEACAATAGRFLPLLDDVSAGFETMTNVYAAAIAVLRGLGRVPEADGVAARARALMRQHLRAIPDEESRRAFASVAVHKALLEEAPREIEGTSPEGASLAASP